MTDYVISFKISSKNSKFAILKPNRTRFLKSSVTCWQLHWRYSESERAVSAAGPWTPASVHRGHECLCARWREFRYWQYSTTIWRRLALCRRWSYWWRRPKSSRRQNLVRSLLLADLDVSVFSLSVAVEHTPHERRMPALTYRAYTLKVLDYQ